MNITCQKSRYGVYITGLEDDSRVDGIHLENCEFNNVADNNKITGARNVRFTNLKINGSPVVNPWLLKSIKENPVDFQWGFLL